MHISLSTHLKTIFYSQNVFKMNAGAAKHGFKNYSNISHFLN